MSIKIENIETYGWEAAVRGCRNPKNSWLRSDSTFEGGVPHLGENDIKLLSTLAHAGDDHGKFLRMITVTMDITAPIYWVAEHDTYKVGTVRNSCSFMHKGVSKPFSVSDFSIDDPLPIDEEIVKVLNELRDKYLETKDERIFRRIRQLLPQGYNIRYTWQANYQVIKNIYYARRNHRLPEWHTLCAEFEKLPYFKELIGDGE